MRTIHFPNWPEILSVSPLPGRAKHSFEITIRWYLGFCRRGRAEVHVQSARDFIDWATEQKRPEPWQLEEWKEAIRWFFLAAKEQSAMETAPDQGVWLPPRSQGWPEWKVALLTTLRRRKYSYRQALNALVFLFRDVFPMELGDLSEYRRARVRPHLPTWLTREELDPFFVCLDKEARLMSQVMYGAGLRLIELLRLRVKDLDLEQEIITVRRGKGEKDRFAPLPHSLVEPLRVHLRRIRLVYESDRKADVAGVWLPGSLERTRA